MRHILLVSLVILISTLTAACGPGQVFGPTFTSTPTTTLTPTSTSTSTITPTSTITHTPTPTSTPIGGGSGQILYNQEIVDGGLHSYNLNLMDLDDPPGKTLISKVLLEEILNKPVFATFFNPSPDGSKTLIVACTSFIQNDCNYEYYIASLDLSNLVPITMDITKYMQWIWSPDSTKLLIFEQHHSFYIINSDGSELRKMVELSGYNPHWSFDSSKLYWQQDRDIRVINVDGSNNHRLDAGDHFPSGMQFSTDGQKVAFFRESTFCM